MLIDKKGRFNPFKSNLIKKESALNKSTREYFSRTVDFSRMVKRKAPEFDLKLDYQKVIELSFISTLMFLILTFQVAKQINLQTKAVAKVDVKIEVADIPPTEQFKKPPPPPRPSVPIPTEEESVPEDLTIASTNIDLSDIPPPPSPPEDEETIFVAYDEAPQIIGGFAALQKYLKYPVVAQKAGVEGVVFVKVLVGIDGRTEKTAIIKAKPAGMGFEKSAMSAIQKVKWVPAKQRDRKIRVWVSIPVQFKLISS